MVCWRVPDVTFIQRSYSVTEAKLFEFGEKLVV